MPFSRKKKKELLEEEKKESVKNELYFSGVGRRKTAIAQVRLYTQKNTKEEDIKVNSREFSKYFFTTRLQNLFFSPLKMAGLMNNFKISVLVKGGGIKGQAEACRLGVARALVKYNPEMKKTLKSAGFLTRDSRIVERKKPGLKKARKAPQWQKR